MVRGRLIANDGLIMKMKMNNLGTQNAGASCIQIWRKKAENISMCSYKLKPPPPTKKTTSCSFHHRKSTFKIKGADKYIVDIENYKIFEECCNKFYNSGGKAYCNNTKMNEVFIYYTFKKRPFLRTHFHRTLTFTFPYI